MCAKRCCNKSTFHTDPSRHRLTLRGEDCDALDARGASGSFASHAPYDHYGAFRALARLPTTSPGRLGGGVHSSRVRSAWLAPIALSILLETAACGAGSPDLATMSPTTAPASTSPAAISLLVEPGAGLAPIYALLNSARHRVDLVMYELEDTHAEQLLAADATRGVAVRVLLNSAYTGSANDAAYSYLQSHGVRVSWASPLYTLTHQKTLVVDASVAVIMTLNWTSRYYADTRDVAVIDRIPSDVAAIEATFEADDTGARITPSSGADLVWSPTTSPPDLLALINGATRDLFVENEEMGSSGIIDALITAARRGVNVEICMTNSSRWSTAFEELVSAGIHIRVYSASAALYIHAKLLVRDPGLRDQEAFAGSQNFSTESLRYNRELGILMSSGLPIRQLQTLIEDDFHAASPWIG